MGHLPVVSKTWLPGGNPQQGPQGPHRLPATSPAHTMGPQPHRLCHFPTLITLLPITEPVLCHALCLEHSSLSSPLLQCLRPPQFLQFSPHPQAPGTCTLPLECSLCNEGLLFNGGRMWLTLDQEPDQAGAFSFYSWSPQGPRSLAR